MHEEMKSDLADLMAHKETTAWTCYRLKEKQEACLQAASKLPHIMRSEANKTVQHTQVTSTSCDDDVPEIDREDSGAVGSKARIVWKEDVIALKDLFAEKIKAKLESMTVVKVPLTLQFVFFW